MIIPISAFGLQILRVKCKNINPDYPNLPDLINNMWETMYNANGVGLAAPQINLGIKLFVIDTTIFKNDSENTEIIPFKKVFINAKITKEIGDEWSFNEGCLSIPEIREDITRKSIITIEYYDENFKKHTDKFYGLNARVIQHEYDHINGILFIDKLSVLRKRMIKAKLTNISKGKINTDYKMRFVR